MCVVIVHIFPLMRGFLLFVRALKVEQASDCYNTRPYGPMTQHVPCMIFYSTSIASGSMVVNFPPVQVKRCFYFVEEILQTTQKHIALCLLSKFGQLPPRKAQQWQAACEVFLGC